MRYVVDSRERVDVSSDCQYFDTYEEAEEHYKSLAQSNWSFVAIYSLDQDNRSDSLIKMSTMESSVFSESICKELDLI